MTLKLSLDDTDRLVERTLKTLTARVLRMSFASTAFCSKTRGVAGLFMQVLGLPIVNRALRVRQIPMEG